MAHKRMEISLGDICNKIAEQLTPEQTYTILKHIFEGSDENGNQSQESDYRTIKQFED